MAEREQGKVLVSGHHRGWRFWTQACSSNETMMALVAEWHGAESACEEGKMKRLTGALIALAAAFVTTSVRAEPYVDYTPQKGY